MNVEEMKRAANLVGDTPEFYSVMARLTHIQTQKQGDPIPIYYKACQTKMERNGRPATCQKRVDDVGYCASCGKETQSSARYMARCRFVDRSDSFFVTLFDNDAERILGRPASDFQQVYEEKMKGGQLGGDIKKTEDLLRPKYLSAPLQLTISAKIETYQGESRTQVRCVNAGNMDLASQGKVLLGEVYEMLKMG